MVMTKVVLKEGLDMVLLPDHGGISRPHSHQHLTTPLKVATTALNLMKAFVSFFVLFLFLVSLLPSSLTVCVFLLLEHLELE